MTHTTLTFVDPITDRWPNDSSAGVLEDLVFGLRNGGPYFCDALMVEKLRLIHESLRLVTPERRARGLRPPAFRWNAEAVAWEFYEPLFGVWTTLRRGPHVSTRPMTFTEGIEYIVTHPLVCGRERETWWVPDAIRMLDIQHFPDLQEAARGGAADVKPAGEP